MPKERRIKYAQNFTYNPKLVRLIIHKSKIPESYTVLDIGAGRGQLTMALAERFENVIAIEKDEELFEKLSKKVKDEVQIKSFNIDFEEFKLPADKYAVFSNIPFNKTADIVKRLIYSNFSPEYIYLFLDKRAAFKFSGFGRESEFSLLNKPRWSFKVVHRFSKTDFDPPPSVDVVLLEIIKRKEPLLVGEEYYDYKDFIKAAVHAWKPNIKKLLTDFFGFKKAKTIIRELKLNGEEKPTHVKFEDWLEIYRMIKRKA